MWIKTPMFECASMTCYFYSKYKDLMLKNWESLITVLKTVTIQLKSWFLLIGAGIKIKGMAKFSTR